MAKLVPCLALLRATFDDLFPDRDHASDGWIGDAAHRQETSDHNPDSRGLVHAIDVDDDLGEGADMQAFVDFLVGRCRSGAEKRLIYVIYNRRIASATHEWAWRTYTGESPHTEHAHFSAGSTPGRENDTTSWHLEEVPVALTAADKTWFRSTIVEAINGSLGDVVPRWSDDGGPVATDDPNPTMTPASALFYAGATARRVENAAARIEEKLTPPADSAGGR